MNAIVVDPGPVETCFPLTATRPLAACQVGAGGLEAAQLERLAAAALSVGAAGRGMLCAYVRGDAWLSADSLRALAARQEPAVLRDAEQRPLAWISRTPDCPPSAPAVAADPACFLICFPWDLLRINEELVGALDTDLIEGALSPAAHVEGRLVLGRGSRILPGVYIEGNVVIGTNTRVGPNSYLRGATSIGDDCHIGQAVEIKNSIIMRGTGIGHLSYCGDSIVGAGVNFGAGTITANFRHDGRSHRSLVDGRLLDTGRRKFGAVIGDDVHTGIHTSIYPGRKLAPHVWTRPGAVIKTDLYPGAESPTEDGK